MKQFCTFFLDDLLFGVDVLKVQEVILYQSMTQVPLAPSSVRGLINLRGQIVTAIDLRDRMDLATGARSEQPKNIVVQTDDGAVSLLVDEIGEVIEPDEDSFEERPESLSGIARRMVEGVYKLEDRLLVILDTEAAIAFDAAADARWAKA